MKNLIALTLACLLSLSFIGCTNTSNSTTSNSTKTPSANNSYVAPTQKTLSTSEKKELAKNEALAELKEYIKQHYDYGAYNINATKFSIGSVIENGSSFNVSGKLYFYDKYGSIKDIANFSTIIGFHSDGRAYRSGSIYISKN